MPLARHKWRARLGRRRPKVSYIFPPQHRESRARTPLLSACPCFLTFYFTLSSSRRSIALSSLCAWRLPPPDILSASSLHCFLCLPVTLSCHRRRLKGAVKILGISRGRVVHFFFPTHSCLLHSAAHFTLFRNRSACVPAACAAKDVHGLPVTVCVMQAECFNVNFETFLNRAPPWRWRPPRLQSSRKLTISHGDKWRIAGCGFYS